MAAAEAATLTLAEEAAQRQQESVFTELLGLPTFINCTATYTVNGGSMMLESVRSAMARANEAHLDLNSLNERTGARIAELLQVEAAMVTSGASGAIALAGGACVAGTDPELMQAIPDLSDAPRDQFIVDSNLPTGSAPAPPPAVHTLTCLIQSFHPAAGTTRRRGSAGRSGWR